MMRERIFDLLGIGACIVVVYCILFALLVHAAAPSMSAQRLVIGDPGADSYGYVSLAENLLGSGRFALSATSSAETFRTPGYPAFAALVLFFFKSPLALVPVQILLTALTACLIYLLGVRYFSRGIGIAGAALYSIDPTVILKAFTAYTETLFVFMLVLAIYVLVDDRVSLRRALIGGILLGFLALVRPVGLFVTPLFLLWLLWSFRKQMREAALCALVCFIGICLLVVPWMARNEMVAGHFSLSSIGTYNLLFANVAEFEVYETGQTKDAVWQQMYVELGTNGTVIESYTLQAQEMALIETDLKGHLIAYAFFHAFKTLPFFFSSSISAADLELHGFGVLQGPTPQDVNLSSALLGGHVGVVFDSLSSHLASTLEEFGWLIVWLCAFISMFFARGRVREVCIFFFLLALGFAALTGPISMPPYRMPVEPFILLIACFGLSELVVRVRRVWYNPGHANA